MNTLTKATMDEIKRSLEDNLSFHKRWIAYHENWGNIEEGEDERRKLAATQAAWNEVYGLPEPQAHAKND